MNNDLTSKLKGSDYESWLIVQKDYQKYASGEEIMECGYNEISGYVYIALENGIQIVSCFGQESEYLIFSFETGEEHFFETYKQAEKNLSKIL